MYETTKLSIKPGTVKHDILQALAVTPKLSSRELMAQWKHKAKDKTLEQFILNHLDLLRIANLISIQGSDSWAITLNGLNKLRELNEQMESDEEKCEKAPAPNAIVRGSTITSWGSKSNYTGFDLRRNSVRPGAYDAYDLPSLYGQERKLSRV